MLPVAFELHHGLALKGGPTACHARLQLFASCTLQAEHAARERQQQAELLSDYGATHQQQQWLAQQQWLEQQQGLEQLLQQQEQQAAELRTAAQQLSVAALDQMQQHKLVLCVAALQEAGFGGTAAREAAGATAVCVV